MTEFELFVLSEYLVGTWLVGIKWISNNKEMVVNEWMMGEGRIP